MYRKIIKKVDSNLKENKKYWKYILNEALGTFVLYSSFVNGFNIYERILCPFVFTTGILCNFMVDYSSAKKQVLVDEQKDEYEELKNEYYNYIDNISEILLKENISDIIQLCLFLDMCLKFGCFSLTDELKYQKYKTNNEHYNELIGCFVLTGSGVCRHYTRFMKDIFDKMNIENVLIRCKDTEQKGKLKGFHLVSGIIYNNKKFVYDFTNHSFGIIEGDIIYFNQYFTNSYFTYKIEEIIDYDKEEFLNHENIEIGTLGLIKLSINEKLIKSNIVSDLKKYKEENKDTMEDISNKALKLMPRK